MPSSTRRRLLGGGAAIAVGTVGTHRLYRGATDATFTSWTPAPGTWPLRRYDPSNTAHNPNASPPRELPERRNIASISTTTDRQYFRPIVGTDHVVMYGSGFAVYPWGGGEAVRSEATETPRAGFGPEGRLHTIRRESEGSRTIAAVVEYGADDLRETYRFPLDASHSYGMTVGSREVYVGTSGRELRAVDVDSGRRWHVDGMMPALGDGQLYAAGAFDGTVAYAQRAGLDRRLHVGPKRTWSADALGRVPDLPAVADGRLVLGTFSLYRDPAVSSAGAVVALDVETGERLWKPRSLGKSVSTLAVDGDRGYAAVGIGDGDAGLVVALDLTTGETVWRDEPEWTAFTPVASDDTLVVAGSVRNDRERTVGKVRAYDRTTGDVLWTQTFNAGAPDGLALVEDRVFVTIATSLYELT